MPDTTPARLPDAMRPATAPQAAAPPPRILAIANQKGGVGKTTTAINLGTALAATGRQVLIIDLDPQGNASTGLGCRQADRARSSYHVLFGDHSLIEVMQDTEVPNLSLIPASVDLSGAEIELVTAERRESRLRLALRPPLAGVDYVLIDCPPSLGLLTLNALVAADAVLVPLQCEFYALEGLSHLLTTIERVQAGFNPDLAIHGILLTMFDRRNNLSEAVAQDVRGHLGPVVYDTQIPRNVRVSEAPSHGKPVLVYDIHCTGSQAYARLARELLQRDQTLAAFA